MTDHRKLDVVAIGAHPDDVELGCGGTVARLVAAGRRVGIIHLTRGEAGTRGTPQAREAEATAAAEALGAEALRFLHCGDGSLRAGPAEEDALIAVMREWRPDLVLGPTPADRHPDHGRAHVLVRDATFYAGLARRGVGAPHRPAAVFSYMQHHPFEPAFIVDVTSTWATKEAALACYPSQFHQGTPAAADEPMTKVSSPAFAAAIRGRARHFGQMIGADFGEPFWSPLPLSVPDLMSLVPGGLR